MTDTQYDIRVQYFNEGDTAWWMNYFGKIEPVEIYYVQRMGSTPEHAVYYWIKPKRLESKIRTWIYSSIYYVVEFLNKVFNTKLFNKLKDNRFVIGNFFWWPGHSVMVGDIIFLTKEELRKELERQE